MKIYPNNGPTRHIQRILLQSHLRQQDADDLRAYLKSNKSARPETITTIKQKLGK